MKRERKKRRPDHAAKRAKERAGVNLDDVTVRDVQDQVADGRAIFIEDQGGGRSVYLVRLGDARHPVVFNIRTKHIVTVLPGTYPLEDA